MSTTTSQSNPARSLEAADLCRRFLRPLSNISRRKRASGMHNNNSNSNSNGRRFDKFPGYATYNRSSVYAQRAVKTQADSHPIHFARRFFPTLSVLMENKAEM